MATRAISRGHNAGNGSPASVDTSVNNKIVLEQEQLTDTTYKEAEAKPLFLTAAALQPLHSIADVLNV